MNTVILAFYIGRKSENSATSFFDQLVCFATRSRYSHVETIVRINEETGMGVCWSSSPRDGGVRETYIHFKASSWDLYEVKSDVSINDIVIWFNKYNGAKYDWIGAFATKIAFLRQWVNKWFCSEAVATSMNIPEPSKKTPESLFQYVQNDIVRIVKII